MHVDHKMIRHWQTTPRLLERRCGVIIIFLTSGFVYGRLVISSVQRRRTYRTAPVLNSIPLKFIKEFRGCFPLSLFQICATFPFGLFRHDTSNWLIFAMRPGKGWKSDWEIVHPPIESTGPPTRSTTSSSLFQNIRPKSILIPRWIFLDQILLRIPPPRNFRGRPKEPCTTNPKEQYQSLRMFSQIISKLLNHLRWNPFPQGTPWAVPTDKQVSKSAQG